MLIGAHTDTLWGKDKHLRAPAVAMRYDVKRSIMEVANPYGGLIYITVSTINVQGVPRVMYKLKHAIHTGYVVYMHQAKCL